MTEELFGIDARPLAEKMRPKSLQDYTGQEHILSEGKLLRRAIECDRIQSLIFYGPPGTGKTTLARIIANHTKSEFVKLNAIDSNVAELRKEIEHASNRLGLGKKTILFIDEIHRFNKSQQDILLPHIEVGTIRIIGTTTQNPFFAINAPLLSRSQIFELKALSKENLVKVLEKACKTYLQNPVLDENALEALADKADGDARRALNALELAWESSKQTGSRKCITLEDIEESVQKKILLYDQNGDQHYDTTSAFIKSLRGSDPDAALYWLARLLECGEEPRYIARRLVVHAAEDVGLADPTALQTATAAQSAVETIGMPEARIPLAMATLHIALAPKSNSAYMGIKKALQYVSTQPAPPVPKHLKDSHYAGAAQLGNGTNYIYPHDLPYGYAPQTYLPPEIKETFYESCRAGVEERLNNRLEEIKKKTENEQNNHS
jgi:putative ATPase